MYFPILGLPLKLDLQLLTELLSAIPIMENRNIFGAIGNTPCVELCNIVPNGSARVFIKLGGLNPTGSYKDRMARSVIEEAERRRDLKPGMTVVEATGGSTGSSIALVCAIKGYNFTVVSSNAFAGEKLRTMSAFGATLDIVHSPSGNVTPGLIPSMRERARYLSTGKNFYYADQFNTPMFSLVTKAWVASS